LTPLAHRHWQQNLDLSLHIVVKEDFSVGESCQKNYANGAIESVIYGQNEPALQYFQKTISGGIRGCPSENKKIKR
jgi:hypothetical protein